MRIFWWLFIVCFILALVSVGWPCVIFTVPATFWFWGALFMWFLDNAYGSVEAGRFIRKQPDA